MWLLLSRSIEVNSYFDLTMDSLCLHLTVVRLKQLKSKYSQVLEFILLGEKDSIKKSGENLEFNCGGILKETDSEMSLMSG